MCTQNDCGSNDLMLDLKLPLFPVPLLPRGAEFSQMPRPSPPNSLAGPTYKRFPQLLSPNRSCSSFSRSALLVVHSLTDLSCWPVPGQFCPERDSSTTVRGTLRWEEHSESGGSWDQVERAFWAAQAITQCRGPCASPSPILEKTVQKEQNGNIQNTAFWRVRL